MEAARLMLPALLLLAACGPREGQGEAAGSATPSPEATGSAAEPTAATGGSGGVIRGGAGGSRRRASARPAPVYGLPMRLVGTEPSWGGRITTESITLSGTGRQSLTARIIDERHRSTGSAITATSGGGVQYTALSVALDVAACRDGMSDRRYPMRATVSVSSDPRKPAQTLRGCAIREADLAGEG